MKRTRWPRWAQVTRNMVIFLFLALTIWTQLGKPLPYNASLRREARKYLLPAMDHYAEIITEDRNTRIDWTEDVAVAFQYIAPEDRSIIFSFSYHPTLHLYQLTDGPNLLSFLWLVSVPVPDSPLGAAHALYVVLFPPEDSTAAALTLHNTSGTYTVHGERDGEIFIFYARPDPDENGSYHMDSSWLFTREFTYELTFYNETGEEVAVP